jgi:TonB family protein
MADSKQRTDPSDAAARPAESPAVSNNGGGLQQVLFNAFLRKQEHVRSEVDHAGRLAAVLAVQQEITSREPDLEEVLRLVTARAVSILGATGAAIALEHDRVMVCRATAGATGPGLGAYLAGDAGLSAACLRTGQIMRCGDSEADPRVDAQAARTLGIRSMVVAPLFHNRTTVGVFEVFSAKPHFFEDEDSHVIELLSGLVTTAISYASEFEAAQTLESERNAMLQVLEEIKPAIEQILRRQPNSEAEEVPPGDLLDAPTEAIAAGTASHRESEAAERGEVENDSASDADTAPDWVPFMLAPHSRAKTDTAARYDKPPAPQPPPPPKDVNAKVSFEATPTPVEDDFGSSEPEPPPPGFPGAQPASKSSTKGKRAQSAPANKRPAPMPPEPKFDQVAHAAPSVPPDMVATLPAARAARHPSPFLAWATSWRGKLRGRAGATAPAPDGAAAATQTENEFHISLRWRNLMEYAVPAVLTGLLIVVGLQWVMGRQLAAPNFGWGALRTPAPSLDGAPMPAATPVEISPYMSPEAVGLGRTGKSVASGVKSLVGEGGSGEVKDWRPRMPKIGGKMGDLGVTAPVPATGKDSPAINGIENVLPSTKPKGNTVNLPSATAPPPPSNEPVVVVRLPESILDEFLLVRVQPIYPAIAQEKALTGTVVLNAVIGRDGTVKEVRSLSGNKYLAESAITAVSQWRYKPFVLNGKPVEVATEVRIAFKKQPGTR